MSCERKDISIELSPEFKKAFKRLAKRYRSLGQDFGSAGGFVAREPDTRCRFRIWAS